MSYMWLRIFLYTALCLSSASLLAESATDFSNSGNTQEDAETTPDQLDQQLQQQKEEVRQQIILESEDPQEQKRAQHEEKVDELSKQPSTESVKETAPVKDKKDVQKKIKEEEQEPQLDIEEETALSIEDEKLKGKIYGSIRLHVRETVSGSVFGDAGSRFGAEAELRTRPDTWVYARVEAGFNVLDEIDTLLTPGGGAGEGKQGDSVFPRLYSLGIETPAVFASYGKSWSTYYRIANFTDRFDSIGSSAVGTFNANTDGGETGTGRANEVLQTRVFIDFLPQEWEVKPFNLNIQLQSDQSIPWVDGVNYAGAFGLSAVLESTHNFTFGLAYNRAHIADLNNPAVVAAGIQGDAEAMLAGARWFDEHWYLAVTAARLRNHETTDLGTYFLGWGSELYTRYQFIENYWLVAGYNWLFPDKDETQAGQYELKYGVIGLRYSIDDFKRLVYAELRLDNTISENGEELGDIYTVGMRWDF